jgi:hypothetical protein
MTDRIPPNPHSPYATADPDLRHLIPSLFGILPNPGGLTLTACERMAVVPDGTLGDATDALAESRAADLPPGLCPICVGAVTGESVPGKQGPDTCRECGSGSSQGEWCALCRQELHDEWCEEQARRPVRIQRRRSAGWRMPENTV